MNRIVPFKMKDYTIAQSNNDFYKDVMERYGYEFAYDGYPLTAVHIHNTQLLADNMGTVNQNFTQNTYVYNTSQTYNDYRQFQLNMTQIQKTIESCNSELYMLKDVSKQIENVSKTIKHITNTTVGKNFYANQISENSINNAAAETLTASVKKKNKPVV